MLPSNVLIADKICRATPISLPDIFDWKEIDQVLNRLDQQKINEVCWEKPKVVPTVSFVAAYHQQALIIKFYVEENSHQAIYQHPNDPVFKDSCVEFFIAIDDSGRFYNFEFNSLGTCLASYGENRYDRKKLNLQQIKTIKRQVKWINYAPDTNTYQWEITIVLQPNVFYHSNIARFETASYNVNFYKCGDDLIPLHYLAWSKVASRNRDFHQPKYFGILQLE